MPHLSCPRRALILCFRLLLLLGMLAAGPAAPPPARAVGDELPGEVLLRLRPGLSLDARARAAGPESAPLDRLLRSLGAGAAAPISPGTWRLRLAADPTDAARRLAAVPAVVYAEPNHVRAAFREANDTLFPRQTALRDIHAPEAWDITTGGAIPIAILDTGVSPTHLDLKRKLIPGYNTLEGNDNTRDDEGHGTHMAGVAAAESDNGMGVAGVCWGCLIMPIKALNRRGQGNDASIAEGIRWAADHGARIISLSLGGRTDSQTLREAVEYARGRGVLLVAATGNGQQRGNLPNYPAAYPGVLAVAATTSDDQPAPFSTSGDFVALAAPGVGVLSTLWIPLVGDDYGAIDGTSPAAPHVAGAAALVWSVRPELTPDQVAEVLKLGADDIAAPGRDRETGYGRLNVARALAVASDPALLTRSAIQGTVAGAPLEAVTITLSDGRTARPDASGAFRFDGLAPGSYTVTATGPDGQTRAAQASVTGTALSMATVRLSFAPPPADAFAPVGPPADPAVAYFPETGHTLRGAFRRFWEQNGGLPVFGYPISEELTERGEGGRDYVVQYFERHRFEYHPENAPPYDVLLARMGDAALRQSGIDWFSLPRAAPQPGCLYFAETGHNVCGAFLRYWRTHGLQIDGRRGVTAAESLALFGLPLTEAQLEFQADGQTRVVQWFERARFESHDRGVLLGLLGSELVQGLAAQRAVFSSSFSIR